MVVFTVSPVLILNTSVGFLIYDDYTFLACDGHYVNIIRKFVLRRSDTLLARLLTSEVQEKEWIKGNHLAKITDMIRLPHSTEVVTCSYDRSLKVWDSVRGRCLATLTGHSDRVYRLVVIPTLAVRTQTSG